MIKSLHFISNLITLPIVSSRSIRSIRDRTSWTFSCQRLAALSLILLYHFQWISTRVLVFLLVFNAHKLFVVEILHRFCEAWILLSCSTTNRNSSSQSKWISCLSVNTHRISLIHRSLIASKHFLE